MNARGGPQEQASEWNFDIAPGESLHTEEFKLKASGRTLSTETMITVAELQLSSSARKELNKGLEKLQRHDLAGASKRFYNVLKKYPGCAAAWNGLGAIAFQNGEPARAKSDFEKAIEADPQFAPAYLNLGRVLLLAKEYAAGEQLLYKAAGLDPTSVETLSLLAYFQLLRGKLDLAIATANRVHIMQHERYAMVHFIAASAYERQNRQKEAAIQYRQYLQEAPDGLSAERARSALTVLQASAQ
jgi:tetratricopeptide (TPR) repeat protein